MDKLLSEKVVACTVAIRRLHPNFLHIPHYFSMVFAISMPAQGEALLMVMWLYCMLTLAHILYSM